MTTHLHYRTVGNYRLLPPKWRIIEDADRQLTPQERYLKRVDQFLASARPAVSYSSASDPVAWVFGHQVSAHDTIARHITFLIEERRALAQRQLADIGWRLEELMERRPLRLRTAFTVETGELNDVERAILDLEKQKRGLEVALWRDTQELRGTVVTERQEADETKRRMRYLTGGSDGGT
jgi:hypothetical protein